MDCSKIGELLKTLRVQNSMTQKQFADKMNISDKTISKWERGLGCPDISLISELSKILKVNIEAVLSGKLSLNSFVGGNMKKTSFYVCNECANITLCTGNATVSCCGRTLETLVPQKAISEQKLKVETVEDEWFITSEHPMQKQNYISFVAFATGEKLQIIKQYPEWGLQLRLPKRGHGTLFWYSKQEGLQYQLI